MAKAGKFETFIDSLIPFTILLIIVITIVEIFFNKVIQPYYYIVDLADLFIVFVFSMDLLFKFEHTKSIPHFLQKYWFYIVAVFPFFLIFRIIQRFYSISNVSSGSTIILLRYLGSLLNESRVAKIAETFRFIGIPTRFVEALYFYEDPKIRHKIARKLFKSKTKRKR